MVFMVVKSDNLFYGHECGTVVHGSVSLVEGAKCLALVLGLSLGRQDTFSAVLMTSGIMRCQKEMVPKQDQIMLQETDHDAPIIMNTSWEIQYRYATLIQFEICWTVTCLNQVVVIKQTALDLTFCLTAVPANVCNSNFDFNALFLVSW